MGGADAGVDDMEVNRAKRRCAFAHTIFRGLGLEGSTRSVTTFALLAGLGAAAAAGSVAAGPVPMKTIKIFNNRKN